MNFHNFTRDGVGWKTVRSDVAFSNPYLQVREEQVQTPGSEKPRSWTVVHRKGAVVIAPVTREGSLVLVRQERIPIRATIWEFPAGQIDESEEHDEERILSTCVRELREETGYELAEDGEMIPMGHFFPSAGFTDEHSHLFCARPVVESPRGSQHDENEVITECRAFPVDEFRLMIARNEIRDANTLSTFARLVALGLL